MDQAGVADRGLCDVEAEVRAEELRMLSERLDGTCEGEHEKARAWALERLTPRNAQPGVVELAGQPVHLLRSLGPRRLGHGCPPPHSQQRHETLRRAEKAHTRQVRGAILRMA